MSKAKYMKESKGSQKKDAEEAMCKDHPMKSIKKTALKKKMSKYRKK